MLVDSCGKLYAFLRLILHTATAGAGIIVI